MGTRIYKPMNAENDGRKIVDSAGNPTPVNYT